MKGIANLLNAKLQNINQIAKRMLIFVNQCSKTLIRERIGMYLIQVFDNPESVEVMKESFPECGQ